jgi:hypothetical protein
MTMPQSETNHARMARLYGPAATITLRTTFRQAAQRAARFSDSQSHPDPLGCPGGSEAVSPEQKISAMHHTASSSPMPRRRSPNIATILAFWSSLT